MTDNTSVHPTASSHHRFHFLDALRGIAAILVVFLHAPAYVVFRPVHNARLAVDFFFCLSGFVIAFSYERRLRETLGLKRFVVARIIRLYPMYLLGITLGIVPLLIFGLPQRVTHGTMLRLAGLMLLQAGMLPPLRVWYNWSLFPLDFPAWSLFFEMLANIAYAWMVRRRIAGSWLLGGIIAVSLVAMGGWLARGGVLDMGQVSTWTSALGIFRVAFSFLMGVLIFRLFHRQGAERWTTRTSGAVALAGALILIFLLVGPFAAMQTRAFSLITVGVLSPCLVYAGARCKLAATWEGVCSFLGELSYPLYLLHAPLMKMLVLGWIMRVTRGRPAMQFGVVLAALLAAVTASLLASKYYDVPVRRFLTRRYNERLLRRAA
jgi:peptidoglycan/LPS O-acetylase OafA/YrhL